MICFAKGMEMKVSLYNIGMMEIRLPYPPKSYDKFSKRVETQVVQGFPLLR